MRDVPKLMSLFISTKITTATGSTITLLDRVQVFKDKTTIGWIFLKHYSFCELTVVQGHLEHGLSSLLSLLKHLFTASLCLYSLFGSHKQILMNVNKYNSAPHLHMKEKSDPFLYIFLSEAILPDCYLQQGKKITSTSNVGVIHFEATL